MVVKQGTEMDVGDLIREQGPSVLVGYKVGWEQAV